MFILNAYPVLALDPKEEEFLEQNTTPRKVLTLPLLKTIRTLIMHCIQELRANRVHIHALMERSPMWVTALAPEIGYEKAAEIAKAAHKNDTTLRTEALKAGVSGEDYDRLVDPKKMITPKSKNPWEKMQTS